MSDNEGNIASGSNSSNTVGGDFVSGIIGAIAGRRDNKFRRKEARRAERLNISYRERDYARADSSYQRTMADMRKAGLNPILAASGGFGTDDVAGASNAGVVADVASADTAGVATAMQSRLQNAEIKQMLASAEAATEAGNKHKSDVEVNEFLKKKITAETNNTQVSTAHSTFGLPKSETSSQFWDVLNRIVSNATSSAKENYSQADKKYKAGVEYLFGRKHSYDSKKDYKSHFGGGSK